MITRVSHPSAVTPSSLPTQPRRPVRFLHSIRLLLAGGLLFASGVQAQVVATSVTSATDLGRGQTVAVNIDWSRTATGSGDKITVPIPAQLTVNPPAPPAGCVYAAPNMVCDVPNGTAGATGTISFSVRGLVLGGFNLTATGTSLPAATFSGTVRSTGDITVGKVKTSPAGNPVSGASILFTLTPRIASGDDVPVGASIVVTDNLPGTVTDFALTTVTFTGLSPSCNTVVSANASRTLTCTYNGAFTLAQLNASSILVTGTANNNGSFSNIATASSGNTSYFDADGSNNVTTVNYIVDPGSDIQALGTFPATGQITGAAQSLVLTHKNNGPLANPAGGTVETIIPATFTIGVLPSGCTATAGQSRTVSAIVYNGTLVSCTTGALAIGAQQSFTLPLTMPVAPEASSFPVIVTTAPGRADANSANNTILLPYQIVNPYADLRATKSKTPGGPQAAGTTVTNTLNIQNIASSPSAASYDATHPLRIVDYTRPEEVNGGVIAAVTAGWTCTVATGIVPPGFVGDAARTTRIACEKAGPGTLAIGATDSVSFTSTIAAVAAPIELTNRACTGSQALAALGLADANGPQPPDGGRTSNDCADAGTGLFATPVIAGNAQVSIKKESSVDNVTFVDAVASAPTLAGAATTLYWRMTVTTPSLAVNATQDTIPTLRMTDSLPGIVNITGPGAPATGFVTPAITVTTTPATFGSCPNISAGNNSLTCNFTNVPPGTTIVIDVPVSRSLTDGLLTNTATLTSPNAILTAAVGGQLNDNAAVNVTSRVDVALTTKTVAPTTPSVGEILTFTITAQNLGLGTITGAGQFTMTDTLNTGVPTLVTPAYDVISVTPSNAAKISCAASNIVTGAISCTNVAAINRYETQTITIKARVKKPTGIGGAANSVLYTGVVNTASVTLDPSYCEYKIETSTNGSISTACNDAASTSNNSKAVTFDIKVPAIDLQQAKVAVYPGAQTQFLLGDQLRYRFSIRNAGPSRAEDVIMTDVLTIPAGFHISVAPGMPDKINLSAPNAGYTLVSRPVICTQAGADANVICKLDPTLANNFLDAGQEVNFEVALDTTGTASGPVVFGNQAFVCADETNVYESSGKCSSNPAIAGNNLAAVNNVVFPKADLEVVSKTVVTASPADIAQPVAYDIVLRNNGTSATTKLRLVDTLPTGFEWMNTGAQLPVVSVNGGSAATLSGALTVVGAVPANGTDNVCFISNGITTVTTLAQQQAITCDITGSFPAGAANTVTLRLYARAKPGLYDGSAPNAPYLTNRSNSATIFPGKDSTGTDIAIDSNPANNTQTANVQIRNATVTGRVFLDLNNNGDQNGAVLAADQGIGGVTITLTGTDKYGNAVSRTVTSSSVAAGAGSLRGDYLFDNLAPSDVAGYTITETQPSNYGNGTPQANTVRTNRNGVSTATTPSGGSYAVSNTAGSSTIAGVVLGGGATAVQFDFPEIFRPSLSGFVYADTNNDGVKDVADTGINGQTVTLIGCSAGPNGVLDTVGPIGAGPAVCTGDDLPVSKTTVTANDATNGPGYYEFALDEAGRYSVIEQAAQPLVSGVATLRGKTSAGSVGLVTSPPGSNDGGTRGTVNATGTNSGGSAGVLNEANSVVAASQIRDVVISNSAAKAINNNFGEILPAAITGFVYTERGAANSNFTPATDWPFAGVTITLTGTDDLGQAVSLTTTTLPDGSYVFNNLRPGTVYQVTKTNPSIVIVNEAGGAFPGRDAGNVVNGARINDNTIATISLASGTAIAQTNFAVTNGPSPLPPAAFKILKSHVGDFQVAKPALYTLTVTNIGGSPSSGPLRLSDLLPVGMTLATTNPITTTAGTIANVVVNGQLVKWDFTPTAPIAAGQTLTFSVNLTVGAAAIGNVINYVSVTDNLLVDIAPGPACANLTQCANDPSLVKGPPVLSLAKTAPAILIVGSTGEYVLTIKNGGQSVTEGVIRVVEKMPAGLTLNGNISSTNGSISNVVTTGDVANGLLINFDFAPNPPLAAGTGSASITVPANIGLTTVFGVLTNYASVGGGGDTRDGGNPPVPGVNCADTRCANAASTVTGSALLAISKTANKNEAELGDMVSYTVTVTNIGKSPVPQPNVIDRLPAGFRLIDNTVRVTGAKLLSLRGAPGPQLTLALDGIAAGKSVTITYRLRLGVGSMQGDGVNRVTAQCPLNSNLNCANEARARVKVSGGVFSNEAAIVGAIYVDCNGNQIKDKEELGIPGVRLYMENGNFIISDSEGKYSFPGLSPKTHVLKVDQTTLPRGSRMVASSNRNAGDAESLFLDLKNGELQRADFIEGSCSNTVVEQVKARRTQGEVSGPQTEKKGGGVLIFEGKAANYPQEGSDSANQRVVSPRKDSPETSTKPVLKTDSERDTTVQNLEVNQGERRAK